MCMFVGEGGLECINKCFYYLFEGMFVVCLFMVFDFVIFYGEDLDYCLDIYGKIGNFGVSVCFFDDVKWLYFGFDFCDFKMFVFMIINGLVVIICVFFMNVVIDQQCEKYIWEYGLEDKVEAKLKELYDDCGLFCLQYCVDMFEINDQFGLFLLGVIGDQILEEGIYNEFKVKVLFFVCGIVQADIFKED